MFSVLIPCYNQDVTALVSDLANEGDQLDMPYEIRCYDDGSSSEWKQLNASIAASPKVIYRELPQNLGRSAIRHKLASDATYSKLIFLDGDSGLTQEGLLSKYMKTYNLPFVSGGRIYPKEKSAAPYLLHWSYGTERESLTLARRQSNPAAYFHSNNFMIDKLLFLDSDFDQGLEGYGYEDLLFANRLQDKGITVTHIDNPVYHLQLDATEAFLAKTRNAVANLKMLNAQGVSLGTRLERAAHKLQRVRMSGLASKILGLRESAMLRNLHSDQPRMRIMDYYKLLHYLKS